MIWAAVDLLGGRCVQLLGGDPATARFTQDPVEAAQRFAAEGADGLHLIDLDAALGRGDNRRILREIIRAVEITVQIGGGIRDERAVTRWLDAGAERVIVGTRGVEDPEWLRAMAARFPRRIVLALDARGEEIVTAGWRRGSGLRTLELARRVDPLGLAALLYTNVEIEGTLRGLDPQPIAALCRAVRTPVLVAGGLRTAQDVHRAYQLGAAGVVLGTALYAGTIDLKELKTKGVKR